MDQGDICEDNVTVAGTDATLGGASMAYAIPSY